MGDEPKDARTYDTKRLRGLQHDLGRLNDAFLPGPTRGRRAKAQNARSREDEAEQPGGRAKPKSAKPESAKPEPAKSTPAKAKAKAKSARPEAEKAKDKKSASSSAKSKRANLAAEAVDASAAPTVDAADKGKAGARRLLAMLRRTDGDDSPLVPGTDFTEGGVVRLLAHLRRRKSQSFRFLRRLLRVLTRPAALGMRTSAGVSVERLQLVGRQLEEIELHGWDHFQSRRVARRGRQALPFAPAVASPDTPAKEV